MRKASHGYSVDEVASSSSPARVPLDLPPPASSRLTPLTVEDLEEVTEVARERESGRAPAAPAQSGAFLRDVSGRERGLSALRQNSPPPPPPLAAFQARPAPSALQAFYGALPSPPERVSLRVDDLSLDYDNPFTKSSLAPPPPRSRKPWLILGGLGVAVALLGAGYLTAVVRHDAPLLPATSPSTQTSSAAAAARPAQPGSGPAWPAAPTQPIAAAGSGRAAAASIDLGAAPELLMSVAPASPAAPQGAPAAQDPASPSDARGGAPAGVVAPAARAPRANQVGGGGPLPAQPSREDVKLGMDAVRGVLDSCAAGGHGAVTASVVISGTGRVSYALIEGAFAGTPAGSCMARALRDAQFPRFSEPSLTVRYPFVF